MAGAAAIPAAIKGVSAAYSAGQYIPEVWNGGTAASGGTLISAGQQGGAQAAVDAGTSAFSKSFSDVVMSPSFLTTVGLGLAGILLGSGSKRPTLSLPALAATAAVGISVTNLLAKGKAAASASVNAQGGQPVVKGLSLTSVAPAEDVGGNISKSRERATSASYSYPMNGNNMYFIKFMIRKYERLKVTQDNAQQNPVFDTIIRLPLPAQIMDAIRLAYNDVGLGMFGGEALKDVGNIIDTFEKAKGGLDSKLGAAFGAAKSSFSTRIKDDDFMYALGRRMLQGTQFGNAADILTGTAPNPHMAVTFQGVNLKKHAFTWRFSPDSIDESKHLQNIIKEFQKASLPEYESDNKFLFKFPDVVNIQISPSNLMVFQPCALDSVIVNYAPNGVPSFFTNPKGTLNGGTIERYPTEVEFTITLRELDVHTKGMEFYNTFLEPTNPLINDEPAPNQTMA